MKIKVHFLACLVLLCSMQSLAQSTVFVVKGGLSAGTQKWDNQSDQGILPRYHVALAIESLNEEKNTSAVFAQLGYHVRGSRQRFRFLFQGGGVSNTGINYQFNNLALILGAKAKKDIGPNKFYYYGGVRGEYTLNTNLDELSQLNPFFTIYYPSDGFVRHWNAGFSGGAGIEYQFRELVGGQIEFSIHPDFTLQYRQPSIGNVIDPNNPGQTITINQRNIRNLTFELSVGLRLVRKVIYEE